MSRTKNDYLRVENEFKKYKIPTSSEEMIYRIKKIKSSSLEEILNENECKCTLCHITLKQFIIAKKKCTLKSHPLLDVLVCSTCFYSYLDKSVKLDATGNVENCAWCLGLSKLLSCASCFGRFCEKCVRRNFNKIQPKKNKYIQWRCYACNTQPLWDYRLINYCVQKCVAENMDSIISENVQCSNKLTELQYTTAKDFLNKYVISIGCLSKIMLLRIKQISDEHFTKSALGTSDNVACCFNKLTIFHNQALENFDHLNKTLRNDFLKFQKEHFAQISTKTNEINSNQEFDRDLQTISQEQNETQKNEESFKTLIASIDNDLLTSLEENISVQTSNDIHSEHSIDMDDDTCVSNHSEIELRNDELVKVPTLDNNLNENSDVDKSLNQINFLTNLGLQTQKMSCNLSSITETQVPTNILSQSTIELVQLNENGGIFTQSTIELNKSEFNVNGTNSKSFEDNNFKEDTDTLDVAKELDIINSESDEEYKEKCKLAIKQILSDSLSSSDSELENVNNAHGKIVNIIDMYNKDSNLKKNINVNNEKENQNSDEEVSKLVKLSTLNKNRKRLIPEQSSDNISSDEEHSVDSQIKKRKKIKKSLLESNTLIKSTSDESDAEQYPISRDIPNPTARDSSVVCNYLDTSSSSDNENTQEGTKENTTDLKKYNETKENNENDELIEKDNASIRTEIFSSTESCIEQNIKENNCATNEEENNSETSATDKTKSNWRNDTLLHGNLNCIDNANSKKVNYDIEIFNVNSDSDDSIIFFENENIDDVINKSTTIPQERKKRKLTSPEIILSSDEDNKDESDDDVVEIIQTQAVNDANGKGRRNIRPVISDDFLLESTKKANKEELERIRRLGDIRSSYQEIETEHLSEGCKQNAIVLEYDLETKQPLIEIHPKLCAILKEHQVDGIKFMWDSCIENVTKVTKDEKGTGCIVAHCMGLGKTLQVITFIHTLLSHPITKIRRVLVIVPSNTVINWKREFNMWLGDISENISVYHLLNNKESVERASILQYWFKNGGVVIISYHLLCNLLEVSANNRSNASNILFKKTLMDPGPDLVVCDEGHILKNSNTLKSSIVTKIRTGRKIMLTGTPMQNNLKEYYCMVNIVKPNLLGSYLEYNNRFVNPILNGQHRDSSEEDIKQMKKRSHVLHKILSGVVQRYEESTLRPFLPPLHHYIVFICLSDIQNSLYKHYLHLININATGERRYNHQVLTDYNVMKNIWTHPRSILESIKKYEKLSKKLKTNKLRQVDKEEMSLNESELEKNLTGIPRDWWKTVCSELDLNNLEIGTKLEILFDIIKECEAIGDKIVVFSTSLNILDNVEYFIQNESVRLKHVWQPNVDYFKIIGSTPTEVRSQYIDMFNNENNKNVKLLLASTKACGQGINMIGANRIVTLDTPWNPADDIQSLFRIYRFGQKKTCYVYSLVSMNTMEQKIYERSVTKQAVACRVVDEQQINRHYIKNDIEELYNYIDLSNLERPAPKLPADRILATMIQKHPDLIWSYHEHKKLLQNQEDEELDEEERKTAWEEFKMEENKRFNSVSTTVNTAPLDIINTASSAISNRAAVPTFSENYFRNTVPSTANLSINSNMSRMILPNLQTSNLQQYVKNHNRYRRNLSNQIVAVIPPEQMAGPSNINSNINMVQNLTNMVEKYPQ